MLVLAIVALEVPLIISLRDRVDAEVALAGAARRPTIVAATASTTCDDREALDGRGRRTPPSRCAAA